MNQPDINTIASNIRSMRIARQMTQQEVANRANISVEAYRNYEKAKVLNIKLPKLLAIAKVFKCRIERFYKADAFSNLNYRICGASPRKMPIDMPEEESE